MPHWHNHNPWKDTLIYLSRQEAEELFGEERVEWWELKYKRLDLYALAQPEGHYCFGLRFGKKPEDYLSLYVPADIGKFVMERDDASA